MASYEHIIFTRINKKTYIDAVGVSFYFNHMTLDIIRLFLNYIIYIYEYICISLNYYL